MIDLDFFSGADKRLQSDFLLLDRFLSFMLPFNMSFQLVFKYGVELTQVAIKHELIF